MKSKKGFDAANFEYYYEEYPIHDIVYRKLGKPKNRWKVLTYFVDPIKEKLIVEYCREKEAKE